VRGVPLLLRWRVSAGVCQLAHVSGRVGWRGRGCVCASHSLFCPPPPPPPPLPRCFPASAEDFNDLKVERDNLVDDKKELEQLNAGLARERDSAERRVRLLTDGAERDTGEKSQFTEVATWGTKSRQMVEHRGIIQAMCMCRGYLISVGVDRSIKVCCACRAGRLRVFAYLAAARPPSLPLTPCLSLALLLFLRLCIATCAHGCLLVPPRVCAFPRSGNASTTDPRGW
jgi:hypothetical protein